MVLLDGVKVNVSRPTSVWCSIGQRVRVRFFLMWELCVVGTGWVDVGIW
ncbi:hypothetical protein [Rubritalea tangerina]